MIINISPPQQTWPAKGNCNSPPPFYLSHCWKEEARPSQLRSKHLADTAIAPVVNTQSLPRRPNVPSHSGDMGTCGQTQWTEDIRCSSTSHLYAPEPPSPCHPWECIPWEGKRLNIMNRHGVIHDAAVYASLTLNGAQLVVASNCISFHNS